jgi:hypothetical protein
VRFGATWGAAIGIGIAIVMLFLREISPFAIMTFSLCPSFYLVFALNIKSNILLYVVMIIGNGVFYGISGAIIGLGFALFQRATARNHNEEGESEKHRKT